MGRNLSSKVRRGGRRGGYRGRGKGRKVKNRDRLGSQNWKTKIDRDIAKFFRPTWITKGKLGQTSRYSDKELELLVTAGQGLGNILKLDKVKWDQNTSSTSAPSKATQLLQSFRYQQLYSQPSPQLQLAAAKPSNSPFSGPSMQRTYGKTYSRAKVKQSISRSNTPVDTNLTSPQQKSKQAGDTINLIPPCQATVVGFRGVLLRNQYLRDTNNCSDTVRQERDLVDNTIRLGVTNPQLTEIVRDTPRDDPQLDGDLTAAHLAADRLLVSRFVQLFLWPAKMSATAPPKQENLFSDSEDESIVIVDPIDATDKAPADNGLNNISDVSGEKTLKLVEDDHNASDNVVVDDAPPTKRRKLPNSISEVP